MKYLGLDVGSKTIGIAVGEVLASELTTLRVNSKKESFYQALAKQRSFEQLSQLLEQEQADTFVVGLPLKEDGNHSEESAKIEKYSDELAQTTGRKVHFVDETLTTFMARDLLSEQGLSPKEIDERVDQLSAQLILQQYLEDNAGI